MPAGRWRRGDETKDGFRENDCHSDATSRERHHGDGRVLNVVATAVDFATARAQAYDAIGRITLEGSHFRTDSAARVAE